MNTAIYTRVSTDEQAQAYGLTVQPEKCQAMAIVKGWQQTAVFSDDGISGTLAEDARPGLAGLLQSAEAGNIGAVIVYSLDRMGRNTGLVLRLVERLNAAGVELVSCRESLDTSTPTGQFVLTMFAALAQLERDTIVERTTNGRNARGRVDGERGGRVPMGYLRGETGLQIHPIEAVIVRRIFAMRRRGAILQAIADQLNSDKIRTRRGGRWHPSSIRAVLENEAAYRGGRRGASTVRWPVILS